MVYVTTLSVALLLIMQIHSLCQTQISLLFADKTLVEIWLKYLDYTDIFLIDFVMKLFRNTNINEYAIEPVKSK